MSQSGPIKSEEIIESGLFDPSKKSAEEFAKVLEDLIVGFKQVNKEANAYTKANSNPKTAKELKTYTEALDKAKKSRIAVTAAEKESAKIKKALTDAEIQEAAVSKAVEKQRQDGLRATAILQSDQIGREAKLLASNTLLRIERSKLTGEEKNYQEEIKRINGLLDANNEIIKENADKQKAQSLNVGNYTDSIVKAIDQTGIYSQIIAKITGFVQTYEAIVKAGTAATAANTVATETNAEAHVANAASIKAEEAATEKLSLAKRALNAITSPVGILIAVAAAIAAIGKYLIGVNQALKDFLDLFGAKLKDAFLGTTDAFTKLEEATVRLRKEIGGLRLELQQFTLDQQDFTDIAADSTLSLNEQNAALEQSIVLTDLKLKKQLEIAQREKEVADLALKAEESRRGVGAGNADQEFYDKQVEATLKLKDAQDQLDDTERINAQRRRERFQGQIIDQIELLRSKKLGADQELAILTKQFNDERIQLEERDAINKKIRDSELKAQAQEFELFQKGTNARIDFNDLVNTGDAVQLANKIRLLRLTSLSDAQATELAKIVKEAQDNQIANNDRIEKQENERIARAEKILQIQRDIAKIEREQGIRDLQERSADASKLESQRMSDVLVGERVFNNKKAQSAINAGDTQAKIDDELAQKRLENLERNAYEQKQAAIRDISDKKIQAAELEKIDIQFQIDRQNLEAEAEQIRIDRAQKTADALTAIEKRKTSIILNESAKVTNALSAELDKRNQRQDQALDQQISSTQASINKQQQLAQQGRENQLAFEEAQLAKQQQQRLDASAKEAREKEILQTVEAYFNAYNARLNEPGANPNTAPALALSDVLLAKGIAKGLVQFAADGNDDVQGKGTTTSDSIPFMLSKHEGVVKADANISNKGVVKSLNNGTFTDLYMPRHEFNNAADTIVKSTVDAMYYTLLIKEQNKSNLLLKQIANKPVPSLDVDKLGNLVHRISKNGNTKTTIYKTRI